MRLGGRRRGVVTREAGADIGGGWGCKSAALSERILQKSTLTFHSNLL